MDKHLTENWAISPGSGKTLPPILSTSIPSPFTVQVDNFLSVRLYQDSRPACLETAPLQKGLVLVLNGNELVEEGMGFGVPVVKYKDKTYFSSSANSLVKKSVYSSALVKSFVLDTVSRKRIGNGFYVDDKLYHFLHRAFELLYLKYPSLARSFNRIMELRRTFKIQTEFRRVKPRGKIIFEYCCTPKEILIKTELSLLELDRCREILILNEQGSSFFRRYADSSGLVLFDQKIGAWTEVTADTASLSDSKQTLEFAVKSKSASALFRGWEKTRNRFSWGGLAYRLPPRNSTFCYSIRLSLKRKMAN